MHKSNDSMIPTFVFRLARVFYFYLSIYLFIYVDKGVHLDKKQSFYSV